MATWTPKPPEAVEFFPLDLVRQLADGDHIQSCTCQIAVIHGDDPDAGDMLLDDVLINGTIVSQKVGGGILGCRYQLTFTVTTLFGEVLKLNGNFFVGSTAPGNRDLTTLQAVKDWLGRKNDDDDALLQRLITAESMAIEKAIQRPILTETRTDFIQGYGSATIMPPATPIQHIELVLIDGAKVNVRHDDLSIWRTDGGHWPRQSRIQVTYTAGYNEVPYDLEQACIELVALRFREKDWTGHQSKSLAGETVSFVTKPMPDAVRARIAPYKKVAPV